MEKIDYTPDEELIKFAEEFSVDYKDYSTGTYLSDEKGYTIEYLDKFPIPYSTSIAQCHKDTGVYRISKALIEKHDYHADFIFYLIIWMDAMKKLNEQRLADVSAMQYYMTTDKSKKQLFKGVALSLMESGNQPNQKRYKQLADQFLTE